MKVDIIGCSTAWTERPTSSYCINDDILVDCGEGTLKYYGRNKIDFYKIKNIFITHLHGDHTFALYNYLCQHIGYNTEEQKKSLTIYGPVGLKTHLFEMIKNFASEIDPFVIEDYVNVIELSDFSQTLQIDNLKVKFFKLKHGKLIDIAYVFDDGKIKIGFSGDCILTPEIENFIELSDIVYLECCSFETSASHLGLNDYKMLHKKYSNKQFYAIHCIDKIYKNYKEYGIEIAEDGKKYIF